MNKFSAICLAMVMAAFLFGGCSSPATNLSASKTNENAEIKTMATNDAQAERYLIHKNGDMVFDSESKLVWMRCSLGQKWDGRTCMGDAKTFTYDEAKKAAYAFNEAGGLNGHTDWIVPDIKQLQSLRFCSNGFINIDALRARRNGGKVGTQCKNGSLAPPVSMEAMPGTPIGFFKSSSIEGPNSSFAWGVDFKDGSSITCCGGYRPNPAYVRLVRALPLAGVPIMQGFSSEQLTNGESVIRIASSQWSYDDLKGATQRLIDLGNKSNSVYSVHKSGAISSFANQKTCSLDVQNIRKFLHSGAAEIWNRHGRADVDELHSIAEEYMFWVGDCLNGKANGEGVVVYFYQGKINSSRKIGAVRSVVTVKNGVPTGTVFAYSNSKTCSTTCQDNNYAKAIGKLNDGSAGVNIAQQDVVKVANQNNQAMGVLLGGAMVKAAEVLKEGAASSSNSVAAGGGTKVYSCTVQCLGSLYAKGVRIESFRVNGNDQGSAAKNASDEAGKSVCKGGGKGDFSRAWWADVNHTSCKLL